MAAELDRAGAEEVIVDAVGPVANPLVERVRLGVPGRIRPTSYRCISSNVRE